MPFRRFSQQRLVDTWSRAFWLFVCCLGLTRVSAVVYRELPRHVTTIATQTANATPFLFKSPCGIAVDPRDLSILVTDYEHGAIYRVAAVDGVVTTVATGLLGPWGIKAYVPLAAPNRTKVAFFVCEQSGNRVGLLRREEEASAAVYTYTVVAGTAGVLGHTDGAGSVATFTLPTTLVILTGSPTQQGLRFDGRGGGGDDASASVVVNFAVSETDRIRIVNWSINDNTFYVSTLLQRSASLLIKDPRLAFDSESAALFFADRVSKCVIRAYLNMHEGPPTVRTISVLAGSCTARSTSDVNGIGVKARFNAPNGALFLDDAQTLLVSDYFSNTIRAVTMGGSVVTLLGMETDDTIGGLVNGFGTAAQFNQPCELAQYALNNGDDNATTVVVVVVADTANKVVRVVGNLSRTAFPVTSTVTRGQPSQTRSTRFQPRVTHSTSIRLPNGTPLPQPTSAVPAATPEPTAAPPPSASASTVSVTSTVSASGAAVASLLGGTTAAGEASSLALLGMMSCAPETLRTSVGPLRYLISPFVDFGFPAMVLGNIGLLGGVVVLQAIVVGVAHVYYRGQLDVVELAARTRCPNVSLVAMRLSVQGIVCGVMSALASFAGNNTSTSDNDNEDGTEGYSDILAVKGCVIVVGSCAVVAFFYVFYRVLVACKRDSQYTDEEEAEEVAVREERLKSQTLIIVNKLASESSAGGIQQRIVEDVECPCGGSNTVLSVERETDNRRETDNDKSPRPHVGGKPDPNTAEVERSPLFVVLWLFKPRGMWQPLALQRRLGSAFSAMHGPRNIFFPLRLKTSDAFFVVLSRLPLKSCTAAFAMLFVYSFVAFALIAYRRPFRSNFDNILVAWSQLLLVGITFLLMLDAQVKVARRDELLASLCVFRSLSLLLKIVSEMVVSVFFDTRDERGGEPVSIDADATADSEASSSPSAFAGCATALTVAQSAFSLDLQYPKETAAGDATRVVAPPSSPLDEPLLQPNIIEDCKTNVVISVPCRKTKRTHSRHAEHEEGHELTPSPAVIAVKGVKPQALRGADTAPEITPHAINESHFLDDKALDPSFWGNTVHAEAASSASRMVTVSERHPRDGVDSAFADNGSLFCSPSCPPPDDDMEALVMQHAAPSSVLQSQVRQCGIVVDEEAI